MHVTETNSCRSFRAYSVLEDGEAVQMMPDVNEIATAWTTTVAARAIYKDIAMIEHAR